MDPPAISNPNVSEDAIAPKLRSFSDVSSDSHNSQTAAEFIDSQLQLEADAREALPYKFEHCTKTLGKLKQSLFSCLTCNPPPPTPSDSYEAAGVCYSCSIQCHGEHTLVELVNKRNFTCDCGTKRIPATCMIRKDPVTEVNAFEEEAAATNEYNHNFRNSFCGCECDYDPHQQKGTMFQCLGLGTAKIGGCGEDWWHPGCVVGLGPDWYENSSQASEKKKKTQTAGLLTSITEVAEDVVDANGQSDNSADALTTNEEDHEEEEDDDDMPLPPGFPAEDDFEGFLCYKCVDAHPWIKRYAGAPGFLAPVFRRSTAPSPETGLLAKAEDAVSSVLAPVIKAEEAVSSSLAPPAQKRKLDADEVSVSSDRSKRVKASGADEVAGAVSELKSQKSACKLDGLPPAPTGQLSLFFKADFRDHLCHCGDCFPLLRNHEQLIEEEMIYEPELSEDGEQAGGSTVGSGSIYERGESVLKNVDRVRAIEGVMAFNHLKQKLLPLFEQFAGTGNAISAEDIKAHFDKMRGDDQAMKDANLGAKNAQQDGSHRKEQGGY